MAQAVMNTLASTAASRFGESPCVRLVGGEAASFADIERRSSKLAGGLKSRGIGAGDRVILYLPNCLEWIVTYHAIARLGAVVVPANALLTPTEIAFIAANSNASGLFCKAGQVAQLGQELRQAGAAPQMVALGEGADATRYTDLADGPSCAAVERNPDDLFAIAYTSGTTGTPKGATLSHRSVFDSAAMTATIHVRTATDRVLSALPLPHVYGNAVLNAGFFAGYQLFVMPRFDAGAALRLIGVHAITLFEGVPTMYYQMLQSPGLQEARLDSLSRCTVGGQMMPVASIEEVESRFGCPLLELWGMTELAGPATSHSPYWPARHGSIGLPFPGMEARIAPLEADGKQPPGGEPGELQVRGSLVTSGYWNNPAATAAALDADGWFSTGDVAVADKSGYLTIVDRRKDMIITAGYNVYPAELEQVIARHEAVAMVAVAAVPDAGKGELPKAYIVLRPGRQASEAEIIGHCRQHLAAYKAPRLVAFVDDLPKTSTGKIMRRALADMTGQPPKEGS